LSSASTTTPDYAAQNIYVEKEYVPRFLAWFVDQQFWVDVQWVSDGLYQLRFAVNVDLRSELPTALRGKFSRKS
jgi:hypothetical protein